MPYSTPRGEFRIGTCPARGRVHPYKALHFFSAQPALLILLNTVFYLVRPLAMSHWLSFASLIMGPSTYLFSKLCPASPRRLLFSLLVAPSTDSSLFIILFTIFDDAYNAGSSILPPIISPSTASELSFSLLPQLISQSPPRTQHPSLIYHVRPQLLSPLLNVY